jgi:tyrosine-specific transport protein
MRLIHSLGHVVGGTLLVAGTTIGVGMLALPVATGSLGFVPSFALYILCWLFMLCTGMLLVEVNLWMPKDKSFISMAEKVLGSVGKNIFWIAYLFLFITVMIAHVAGGGEILKSIPGWPFPLWLSGIIYTLVFAPVVYLGTRSVDRLNLFLISGVVFFYLGFIAVSISSVRFDLLKTAEWRNAWFALPILFTAFTYQVIIPTLMSYMEQNVRKEGPLGLIETASLGQNAVTPLKYFVQSRWILTFSHWFAFFALTTSFIPLALSFFDFLADGLNWEKKGMRRFSLTAIVFGVPTVIAILYPNIFLVALGYAGGISCAFLFGLMPPLMVWIGRYVKHYPAETRQLFGGKPFLVILMVFAFLILAGEIFQQIF